MAGSILAVYKRCALESNPDTNGIGIFSIRK